MSLMDELNTNLKEAMKSKDKTKLTIVRMLKANLMNEKIELGHDLTPEEEGTVVKREIKQHNDSVKEFKAGGRDDLVQQQEAELKVLAQFAPEEMSAEDVQKVVDETVNKLGASGKSDFGKVMGAVMGQLKGKADGSVVNKAVNKALK